MENKSIIPEKVKDFQYYLDKIPIYLKNSYGFVEHFKIWHELLVGSVENPGGITTNSEILLNLLNIFDEDYLEYIGNLEDSGSTEEDIGGTHCDILDKIGSIFGVTRYFKISYIKQGVPHINEQIILNNKDFLILIKSRIIKNYCDGTLKQINELYKSIGLPLFVLNSTIPATAELYLAKRSESKDYDYSENIEKLFLAGELEIESMGVNYLRSSLNLDRLLFWSEEEQTEIQNGWGDEDTAYEGGEWVL